jgi:hypothetical protein
MKMKLSTKQLFTTLRNSPKNKVKIIHKGKLSSPFVTLNSKFKKRNFNINEKLNSLISNENPFSKPQNFTTHIKSRKESKMFITKNKKPNLELSEDETLFNDSYFNNILLTSESDSNNFEKNIITENKELNKEESDIDKLCGLFRQSNLKSAIVIDNKGNNNLNPEQKKMIDNYFSKNGTNCIKKNKINTIPVEKYKENKKLFINTPKKINNQKGIIKFNTNKALITLNGTKTNNNGRNTKKLNKIIIHKKLFSTKEAINPITKYGKFFDLKKELIKEKNEACGDSIFENCTNKSLDSSFLGSIVEDDFYKGLADQKT